MKKAFILVFLALIAFAQGAWAQTNREEVYAMTQTTSADWTALNAGSTTGQTLGSAGSTTYSIDYELLLSDQNQSYYKFYYPSTNVAGEPITLSSLLAFWKPSSQMSDGVNNSVLINSHYTITADAQCPTHISNASLLCDFPDYFLLQTLLTGDSSFEYEELVSKSVVIMPDYEGYGVSVGSTHPYLAEELTAKQVVDGAIFGLQLYQQLVSGGNAPRLADDWRSFSMGYSQGGAVALAVQRYIEQHNLSRELRFRGTYCGDGPYDLITTLRYYLEDNGTSYGVTTDHRAGQVTLPVVLPMILKGMIDSDPVMANYQISDYLTEDFLATGIIEWLNSKTVTNKQIAKAWLEQLNNGTTTVNGIVYPAPANMNQMFSKQETVGACFFPEDTPWADLSKICTEGFYAYLTDASNFDNVPATPANAYQAMHRALDNNNVCTGWEPSHRIQFMHSKKDMVVPYGNYLAFRNAHPEGENVIYRVDNTYSDSDHQAAASAFLLINDKGNYFHWLDESPLEWNGSGTNEDPYMINNTDEWDLLATRVDEGNNYSGKHFKLMNDISVTTMAGLDDTKSFQGTFDGNGHTLTFTKGTSESPFDELYCAPFRHVKNATIKNLHVAGTIYTGAMKAAGFVGESHGALTLTGCRSSVNINSSKDGDGTHGGFVATLSGRNNAITFDGCVFDGSLTTTTGTVGCGGFVGWGVYNKPVVSNSLMKPSSVSANMLGSTFARWYTGEEGIHEPIITNCYYVATTNLPTDQGTQAYAFATAPANLGSLVQDYGVLKAYENGILYDGTYYVAMTGSISLTVEGYGDNNDKWAFIASPVEENIAPSEVGNLVATIATEYDLYQLNPSTVVWENYKAHEGNAHPGFNLVNGQGYLYATKETKTLVFSGTFNTGTEKAIEGLTAGYNLVGNPFIVDAYVSEPYYTLDGDGATILAQQNSTATPIAPCHGVIVQVDGSENVTFSTTAPELETTHNNGGLNIALAQANTRSNTMLDNAIVSFNEGEQLGKFYFGKQNANIYLPQDGEDYAIVSVGRDGVHTVSTEMPINFKATKDGTYTITVNPEGVELDYLHLIDNMTGVDVDLLVPEPVEGPATYTFNAKTTDYESRFKLVFAAKGADGPSTGSGPFAFISNGNIIINGEGTLQMVDVMGRVILCRDAMHCVSTNGMPAGVYVLRLINGNDVKTQKIVVR